MTELLVVGGYVIRGDGKVLRDGVVAVEDNLIVDVGGRELLQEYRRYDRVDARDGVVCPGFVNTHSHVAMTLMRGVADDMDVDRWLREKIWPIEAKLEPRDVYVGTLLGCLELIRSGTTCVNDMYLMMEEAVKAYTESGIRAVACEGIFDFGDESRGRESVKRSASLVERFDGAADGRIRCFLAPHSPYTCGPETLLKALEEAERLDTGLHIHVAETRDEAEKIERRYGVRVEGGVVKYLERIGFLNRRVVAAHCVWLTQQEVSILRRRDVSVSVNIVSNMKLSDGIPPVPELLRAGVRVGLGTDGPSSNNCLDMFEEMKTLSLVYKALREDPTLMDVQTVLRIATKGGADALGFKDLGLIEPGMKADMIVVDMRRPRMTPVHNPVSNLVYAGKGPDVRTVIVDGRVVMEDWEIKTVDEERVLEEASRRAQNLVSRGLGQKV